jgi:hypothetical protein
MPSRPTHESCWAPKRESFLFIYKIITSPIYRTRSIITCSLDLQPANVTATDSDEISDSDNYMYKKVVIALFLWHTNWHETYISQGYKDHVSDTLHMSLNVLATKKKIIVWLVESHFSVTWIGDFSWQLSKFRTRNVIFSNLKGPVCAGRDYM